MNGCVPAMKEGFQQCRSENGVVYYRIPAFVENGFPKHCFTTRIGGVSPNEFSTLNLSLSREENPENKHENYGRVCEALGREYQSLTLVKYNHGIGVHAAETADAGKGISKETDFDFCDAIITNARAVTALTMHADCVPVFFADIRNRAVGVAHAGWRGVYDGIVAAVLRRLQEQYQSNMEDILIGIGPHLQACCFEVQEDVAGKFRDKFGDCVLTYRNEKMYLNMQDVLCMQLQEAEVPERNITCANLCTHCREDLFYSHRRDQGKTGAMGAFIAIGE